METLDTFNILNDDELYHLCENMDLKDLVQFTRANKRVHDVCSDMLNKRKLKTLGTRWVKIVDSHISSTVYVSVGRDLISVIHDMHPKELIQPILPEMKMRIVEHTVGVTFRYSKSIKIGDTNQMDLLLKNLIQENFRQ